MDGVELKARESLASDKIASKNHSEIGQLQECSNKSQRNSRSEIFPGQQSMHFSVLDFQLMEEEKQDAIAETRSRKNCFLRVFYLIVTSVTFNFLIYCFILANTITLALYRYDQSDQQTKILDICDIIFVWVFTAELVAKIIGLGFKVYIQDKFNSFDAVIVVISLVDFTLSQSIDLESAAGIMSAMRALRLLRVVKLARHWKALQQIL